MTQAKPDQSASPHYACAVGGCRLRDTLAEVERLQGVAVRSGACRCTWDVDENWTEGDSGDGDIIVRFDPDCPVHQQIGIAFDDQRLDRP